MAVIGSDELVQARRVMAKEHAEVTWSKTQVNAAFQALEDWFEGAKAQAAADIETAVPGVFSAAQKKKLGGIWMIRKATRELL